MADRKTSKAGSVNDWQSLPEMNGPSPSDAPTLLNEAYEYIKAQEESGFGDPLVGDNCENFDILQYINGGNETPEGSPSVFCAGPAAGYQHHHQQHQLHGANPSELVQALQTPLQKEPGNGVTALASNFQQPVVLDSVGLVMYNGGPAALTHQGVAVINSYGGMMAVTGHGGRQTQLPDSPPVTDMSTSSISPGSSAMGSASPFSPDQFRYMQQQPLLNGGGILMQQHPLHQHHQQQQHHPSDMLLVNQMHLMKGGQQQRTMLPMDPDAQLSPQSEFLSPYPPSQSTPGSQHSSQVSPPALPHQSRTINNNLLQSQPAMLSVAASFASMDNLYTAINESLNENDDLEMGSGRSHQQHFHGEQQHGHKRRRMSSSAAPGSHDQLPLNNSNNLPNVKSEIGASHHHQQRRQQMAERMQMQSQQQSQRQSFEDLDENMNNQKSIKFEPFLRENWAVLYNANQQPLPPMQIAVVADKGFNFSISDNCFVNQKKNHFQISVNIAVNPNAAGSPLNPSPGQQQMLVNGRVQLDPYTPRYVRRPGTQELLPILDQEFLLEFCGVKNEMPAHVIPIKQSQTDRKPIDHAPVRFTIDGNSTQVKQTVPRLHFSETTLNNHRKNGKPNPEQKFFLLAVKLSACTEQGNFIVSAFHSERVIVRASNPGQFEQPEPDQGWKSQNGVLSYSGPVCVGGDKPIEDAQLTVYGNIVSTGQTTRPSDRRVKEDIAELSTAEAMNRVAQMRLVEFAYKPEIAQQWGLSEQDRHRVGVIAQELAEVLPEAVRDNGDFLTVDDTRIFYDTVAAAQELYRLTGNLENKIGQVEKISEKLARYAQKRKQLGSMASGLSDFSTFFGPNPSTALESSKNCVSYSRTSLTSTTTCNNNSDGNESEGGRKRGSRKQGGGGGGKDNRMPRHRCRSYSSASAYCGRSVYCTGPDSAMCSSKFTQGTIVTLVVIMALCLMAMCTLYVMDWYNRTYNFSHMHPNYYPTTLPSSQSEEQQPPPQNMIEQLWNSSWTPPIQNVPPLTILCSTSSLASLVAGPLAASSCPQYCCASRENNYYERLGEKLNQGVDSLVALASKFPRLLPESAVKKHEESTFEFGNGVHIEIMNLNVSLDARFCLPENCSIGHNNLCIPNSCNPRTGHFNLYVPISPHLPTIPLQLRFSADDPTLLVDSCGGWPMPKLCHFENELQNEDETKRVESKPRTYQITENIFELSAGSFLQSAYKFRVGHSTGLCLLDEKQRGRTFDEFNLIFYRTCALSTVETDENNAAINSAISVKTK